MPSAFMRLCKLKSVLLNQEFISFCLVELVTFCLFSTAGQRRLLGRIFAATPSSSPAAASLSSGTSGSEVSQTAVSQAPTTVRIGPLGTGVTLPAEKLRFTAAIVVGLAHAAIPISLRPTPGQEQIKPSMADAQHVKS